MTATLFQQLMRHYGLTTRSLGAQVGVGRSAISQIARGRLPRVDVAILIARAFDVTVEELWGVQIPDNGEIPAKSTTETAFLKRS